VSDPVITLPAEEAVELAEILDFVCDWLDHDRTRLGPLLDRFSAHFTTVGQLRDDLRRHHDQLLDSPTTTGASR